VLTFIGIVSAVLVFLYYFYWGIDLFGLTRELDGDKVGIRSLGCILYLVVLTAFFVLLGILEFKSE